MWAKILIGWPLLALLAVFVASAILAGSRGGRVTREDIQRLSRR